MISKCIDYLEQNGYYGHEREELLIMSISHLAAERICVGFTDKDGGEVPDDVFDVVVGLIEGELWVL